MKPTASGPKKKVTAENLVGLGAERLAEILVSVAETRVDLKRRLRMELAAEQGAGPLTAEIDKRLNAVETSRGKITWRAGPAFLRDLDALRDLITVRLAPLDPAAATDRLWRFISVAPQSERRYRERNDELQSIYAEAAADLGRLLARRPTGVAAAELVESLINNPAGWKAWLPALLVGTPQTVAAETLRGLSERARATPGWITLIRQLADAAGDVDAYIASYPPSAVATPHVATEVGRRLLAAGRLEEAGEILRAAAPEAGAQRRAVVDFDWETAWIEYLHQAGREGDAQTVRWASFERTLSPERLRSFLKPLADFDDVEAEQKAFAIAARAQDFGQALRFLMEWPALAEASRLIEQRREEAAVDPAMAELWAAKLRRRYPTAAHALLRSAAASAFRRRDFKTCDRLSAEAETIPTG